MTQTGSVYGEALYTLAQEENLAGSILEELTVLNDAFCQEPDFIRLLSSPTLPKQERCRILDSSFRGKVNPFVLNFMKILTEKGYIKHFSDCCKAYEEHYNLDNGILPVTAISAVALEPAQCEKLADKLSRITGKQIKLLQKVDPSILGGIRLDYDGMRVDDTVSHRLDAIRHILKDTVL